jgi:UDP-N-acetylglucosamine:LPS N-acetylglucosamine transferase
VPPRVLILTASVGEGHDLPARTLAAQLSAERPDVEVITKDGLAPMGRVITAISADAGRVFFFRFEWLWDLGFWVFARFGPTRRATQSLLTRVGGPGLLELISEVCPDVIVSTYPNTMEVLARLRRTGRIRVPVGSAITDLAAMHYWAPRGADFYLITHAESAEEVRAVAGPNAQVFCVHGLTASEFLVRPAPESARSELALPPDGKIVLVSGGGWGVGDIEGTVEQALALPNVSMIVCLCGRNERLRTNLSRRFVNEGRVRVEGFTDTMRDWLAAADVLVHSTGGLTVLEALMQGCPAVSYGWGRGHVRLNNAAYRRFGLAEVVFDRDALGPVIRRAIERPRRVPPPFAELPSAASVILRTIE